mmetsp:Transcript_57219/g.90967  ORF Transcript_57219/g.90967 Transcript_57219/m.90967 type:complete len:160 (-) Transcript_57219:89-568(-)
MRSVIALLCFCAFASVRGALLRRNCNGAWYHDTKVTQLCWNSDTTFPPSDNWFIEFYHPKCKFSNEFKSTWIEFAGNTANVGAVDCAAEPATCDHYGIEGCPAMRAYFKGEWYNGPMGNVNMDKLVKWQSQVENGIHESESPGFMQRDAKSSESCPCKE